MTNPTAPTRAQHARKLNRLFAGHADGAYTLPDEVLRARDAITRIDAEMATVAAGIPDVADTEVRLIAAVTDAAKTGAKRLPDASALLLAEVNARNAGRHMQILAQALDLADGRLAALVRDQADAIVIEHLQPAVAEVVEQVAALAPTLPEDLSAAGVLASADPIAGRTALFSLEALGARYRAVHSAAESLRRSTDLPELDVYGEFAELREGLAAVVPGYRTGQQVNMSAPRPWPTASDQGHLRLLHFHRLGVTPWLPTTAQQDAAYREKYRDLLNEQAANQHRVAAAQHAFG